MLRYFLGPLMIVAVLWSASMARAAPDNSATVPELVVMIEPPEVLDRGGYLHGQIVVKILLLSEFPYQSLTVDIPDVARADKIELIRSKNRQTETFGGTRFVFETAFALFPTQSGEFRLPLITAEGVVTEGGQDVGFSITGPAHEMTVAGADARLNDPWWLVAENIEMTETWSKPLQELRAGDTVRRDIQVVATGVTTAHLPTLEHGRTIGVTATQIETTAKDQTTIDGVVATLNQSWWLKFEPQDVTFVAPMGITYWDQTQRLRMTASVPGHRLELLPADSAAIAKTLIAEAQADSSRSWMLALLMAGIALLPALGLAIAFTLAILPTAADLRLGRLLRHHDSHPIPPERLYCALVAWANASGFKLEAGAEEHTNPRVLAKCQRAIFGAQQFQSVDAADSGDLIRYARRQRVDKVQAKIAWIADWWRAI